MGYRAIKISPSDNVAIAVTDIPQGATVSVSGAGELVATQEIPLGHKVSLVPITKGAGIIRYGEVICTAGEDISLGEWVHLHNTSTTRGQE